MKIAHRVRVGAAGTLVLATLAHAPPAAGQPAEEGVGAAVHLGLGGGSAEPALLGLVAITFHGGPRDLILRAVPMMELSFFSEGDSAAEFAVLIGLARRDSPRSWGRVSAGPSLVRRKIVGEGRGCTFFSCAEYERTTRLSFGLGLQADAIWAPRPAFGLGLFLLGHAGSDFRQAAVGVQIAFGRVRDAGS